MKHIKITSVLLSAAMCASMVMTPVPVMADETEVPSETQTTEESEMEEPEVRGAYDLIIHNYGPNKNLASVHLELPDIMTVAQVDTLTRKLQTKVYHKTGVILAGVGVYSFNTQNDEAAKIRNMIQEKVMAYDWVLQMHGFYLDMPAKQIRMDVVMSFDICFDEGLEFLNKELSQLCPEYKIHINPDVDISD